MPQIRENRVWAKVLVCPIWSVLLLVGCGEVTEPTVTSASATAESQLNPDAGPSGEALNPTDETAFQSGMEIGAIPMPFDVEDVTGPNQGKHLCYRCLYGERPVVGIFVRDIEPETKTLIQKIDQEVAAHQDEKLAAFVVVLTDDPAATKTKLEQVAAETKIKHVPLTLFEGTAGPLGYQVANEAAVNVMIWEGEVKANRAFQKGKLNKAGIEDVVADTRLIVQGS